MGPPRPRRPRHSTRSNSLDQHTVIVRRRVAIGVFLVLLLVVVLVVSSIVKNDHIQGMKDYNRDVSTIARESDEQVSAPLFGTLVDSASKTAVNVAVQVDQLLSQAQSIANNAKGLSVPGDMAAAQRNLLLLLDLRVEGLTKLAALLPTAIGGQSKQAGTLIAGDMEIFLASDVIYSQRVAPLIQQALAANGITGLSTAPSRFLPNLGWLEPTTTLARITGQPVSAVQSGQPAPGTHGSALIGVSVGTNALQPEPTLNHVTGGGSPTFTVVAEDAGSNAESNVKVDVAVTAGGKQFKASHVINSWQAGSKDNVEIPVAGIPLGVASKIEVNIEPVPGEANLENNKNTYLAIFEQ